MIILLKASIVIFFLLAFYKLFLEKESFFSANRTYLLACLAIAAILPFIALPKLIENQGYISDFLETKTKVEHTVASVNDDPRERISTELPTVNKSRSSDTKNNISTPVINSKDGNNVVSSKTPPASLKSGKSLVYYLFLIYIFGVIILLLNLFVQISSILLRIYKNDDKVVDTDGILVNMSEQIEPCSFFNYIFINPTSYDYETYEQIIEHEKIHVNKRHSIDLLLSELAVVILWFNPFVWILRKEVEKNIEYQTDNILLHGKNEEKESYQINLVKIACHTKPLVITTNYNQSLIKQRILKMNSKRSNRFNYWKYSFVLPVVFILAILLNKPYSAQANTPINNPILSKELAGETASEKIDDVAAGEAMRAALEAKLESPKFLADCAEFEKAVAEGNMLRVKEILKTLDPDCLKITKDDRTNLQRVENLVKDKKKGLSVNKDSDTVAETTISTTRSSSTVVDKDDDESASRNSSTETQGSSTEVKHSDMTTCEVAERAANSRNSAEVKRILTEGDISCLTNLYGHKSKDQKLLKLMLLNDAELEMDALGIIRIHDAKKSISVYDLLDIDCQDSDYILLRNAIENRDESTIRSTLLNFESNCKFAKGAQPVDLEFFKEMLRNGALIDNKNGKSVTIFGLEMYIDFSQGHEITDNPSEILYNGEALPGSEEDRQSQIILEEIEDMLAIYGTDTESAGCPDLIEAIEDENIELTFLLLNIMNPNCFHRETSSTTIDGKESFSSSKVTTPLIAAIRTGNNQLINLLFQSDLDPDFTSDKGETPLIAAVKNGSLDVVKTLVKSGVRVKYKDSYNKSAMDYAKEENYQHIVRYLKNRK